MVVLNWMALLKKWLTRRIAVGNNRLSGSAPCGRHPAQTSGRILGSVLICFLGLGLGLILILGWNHRNAFELKMGRSISPANKIPMDAHQKTGFLRDADMGNFAMDSYAQPSFNVLLELLLCKIQVKVCSVRVFRKQSLDRRVSNGVWQLTKESDCGLHGKREITFVNNIELHVQYGRRRCKLQSGLPAPHQDPLGHRRLHQVGLAVQQCRLSAHQVGLPLYSDKRQSGNDYVYCRDVYNDPFRPLKPRERFFLGLILACGGCWLALSNGKRWIYNDVHWWHYPLILAGIFCCCVGASLLVFGHLWPSKQICTQRGGYQHEPERHGLNVSQKVLARYDFSYYNKCMANVLSTDKQIGIIGALCEGSTIRSIERTTRVHRDTIMRLGVKVGNGCTALMNAKMRNLDCHRLEMDEIWGFVGKKERHLHPGDDPQFGNVWTFCAIDADTKLVPAFRVSSDRHVNTATAFALDVARRMKNREQISTDGLSAFVDAINWAFGGNVNYGQIIKTYGTEESVEAQRRYSAPKISSVEKKAVFGRPEFDLISTSYVERLNATTRLHMKRLARLTHAFSKKRENFEAAVGLHFAYYNFVRRHTTLRCTPAMAAGVEQSFWTVGDLVEATAA